MNNIFQDIAVGNRYDLKGSTLGRKALKSAQDFRDPQRNVKIALKDIDFIENIGHIHLLDNKNDLIDILRHDSVLFAENSIIDYSLLVGEIVNSEEVKA